MLSEKLIWFVPFLKCSVNFLNVFSGHLANLSLKCKMSILNFCPLLFFFLCWPSTNSQSDISPAKLVFLRTAIWNLLFDGKPHASQENKAEKHSFIEDRETQRGWCKQSPLEETGSLKRSDFSLTELFQPFIGWVAARQEEDSPPSSWSSGIEKQLPVGDGE